MKTKEFIEHFRDLGYNAEQDRSFVYIRNSHGCLVARVSRTIRWEIYTNMDAFAKSSDDEKELIFNLCLKLSRTPLRDREKLKEYHLILTAPLADTDLSYLNLNKTTKKYWFSDKKETINQQTIFTEAEIEKMNTEGLKKVEVL